MSQTMTLLHAMRRAGRLRDIDLQLADFARRALGEEHDAVLLAVALASRAVGEGHTCLDLHAAANRTVAEVAASRDQGGEESFPGQDATLPPLEQWQTALTRESARPLVGGPGENRPLVLAGNRLYLRRYWRYEQQVRTRITAMASACSEHPGLPRELDERLRLYFPGGPDDPAEAVERQRSAARNAVHRLLSILSGGPGTGKTYTLARIVALLAERFSGDRPFRVRIAAPTGKAAARAVESVRRTKEGLREVAAPEVLSRLPEEACTLHRLLGVLPDSPYFRHDREHPLEADLVVVDEASMVDLPLMAKLLEALPPACRLVLVGDRDQLASVEPGHVYGDLCEEARRSELLRACMTELSFSHRFKDAPEVARLAEAVRTGSDDAWTCLDDCTAQGRVVFHAMGSGFPVADDAFAPSVRKGYEPFLKATDPRDVLEASTHFRVLCALRRGSAGVFSLNRAIETTLKLDRGRRFTPQDLHYDHRLILITANDYGLELFNGDVGVVLLNPRTRTLEAWFEGKTGQGGGAVRSLPVELLPAHDTAFAMTIHKSQGSEFNRVALVLPEYGNSPVLTRELLYTGITRARSELAIWCTEDSFQAALLRPTRRTSGLHGGFVQESGEDASTRS